jgi:hypothetical protein
MASSTSKVIEQLQQSGCVLPKCSKTGPQRRIRTQLAALGAPEPPADSFGLPPAKNLLDSLK